MQKNSFANERISNLITPVSYFINHVEQLKNTQENLKKYRKTSIIGTSGIGKTQLIRTYAYENENQYSLVWFFDCNLDLNIEFVKLAKQLNQFNKINISQDPILAKKEVMEYLANKDKWLLVFDNLKINENKKVKDIINWEHNGNVIFCSQDSEMLPHTLELRAFHKKDAITLASNLLDSKDKNDVDFLVEAFSNYPILIVQGAQLLNQVKGLDKEEYKNKIHQSADKIKSNIKLAIKALKPSTVKILKKIALINNQRFSKELLNIIADDKTSVSDDIYQLSKFMLISNTENDDDNPVFEMHDVIAQKIIELNGDENNKVYLEEIFYNITQALPASMHTGHVFRNGKTIMENLEVITSYVERYNLDIYKLMPLNVSLFTDYINTLQYYNADKLFKWFDVLDKKKLFKPWLMDNDNKYFYARYLGITGGYYKNRFVNWHKALEYYLRASEVLKTVNGYEAIKCNVLYNLANTYISLGQLNEAENEIKAMEKMFEIGLVDIKEIGMLHLIKAKLYHYRGNEVRALEESNKDIIETSKNGIKLDDLFFTVSYVLKTEILNSLEKYQDAYDQALQLYKMHKPTKNDDHEIFGRIYTQMARSELGLGKKTSAADHITKAISIFLTDEQRNPKNKDVSNDLDLAASYVVQGDIFFVQDDLRQAIESYKKAQIIYFYLYRENSKNVAQVSYLYKQGAKAACKANDLYNYKNFGQPQVREFGVDHPNTTAMFEYCKKHNMDLWSED
jgi:hypothetical protein